MERTDGRSFVVSIATNDGEAEAEAEVGAEVSAVALLTAKTVASWAALR